MASPRWAGHFKGCVSHNSIPDPVREFRLFRTLAISLVSNFGPRGRGLRLLSHDAAAFTSRWCGLRCVDVRGCCSVSVVCTNASEVARAARDRAAGGGRPRKSVFSFRGVHTRSGEPNTDASANSLPSQRHRAACLPARWP
jgi:hypothetical protein